MQAFLKFYPSFMHQMKNQFLNKNILLHNTHITHFLRAYKSLSTIEELINTLKTGLQKPFF
jgi:hypothetical protein